MVSCLIAYLALSATKQPALAKDFRRDENGWIYLHLEGTPKEIGYAYGELAAKEIDDAHKALALSYRTAPYDWKWARTTAKQLFWDKLDPEYQQEIEGQAAALKAKGYDYDTWDVLAYNANIELHDYYIPYLQSKRTGMRVGTTRLSCSAFVATGSETDDHKIVMGHNLWWDYLMGQRCNLLLDITPKSGHRVLMDAFCGFIHSGSDFAVNSAGMLLCETTIAGFAGFDPNGVPEFMRMRKAIQYGTSLDDMVRIFKKGNNGGYANTWLMGDTKTNEIGKLQLGLKNVIFDHTADGFYVGSNFPENPKLIAEEVPGGWNSDPKSNGCDRRRVRWTTLLTQNRGKVDAAMAKAFLADTYDAVLGTHTASGSTLCGREDAGLSGAVNTKVIDSELAAHMSLWGKMGFSNGSTLNAADLEAKYPAFANLKGYLRDIPNQPWTLFSASTGQ